MSWKRLLSTVTVVTLTCVPVSAEPQQPGATTESDRALNVMDYRCGQMLRLAEDDRASAAMFYYGYLAASVGLTTLDVSKIEDNIRRVMDRCEKTPDITVVDSFKQEVGPGSR